MRKTKPEDDQDLLRREVCNFVEWIRSCWAQLGLLKSEESEFEDSELQLKFSFEKTLRLQLKASVEELF